MLSSVVTANTIPQVAFETPPNRIAKIKFIQIDNQHTSPITVIVQDSFISTPSLMNPTPSQVTKTRFAVTVGAGAEYHYKVDEIDIFGVCSVVASTTSASCNITITYELI